MRAVAVIAGCLLLAGGTVLVVAADQQRVHALDDARAAVAETRQLLEAKKDTNHRLAETLTALRSQIADQDHRLSDPTGLLR